MRIDFNSFMGPIALISLKEFLRALPVRLIRGSEYAFALPEADHGHFAGTQVPIDIVTYLKEGSISTALIHNEGYRCRPAKGLNALDIACEAHALDFGFPSVAVRLSRRTWLIADPNEYYVVTNGKASALISEKVNRIIITEAIK